jgi:uncharacterized protein YsxB (DUF464 family)
VIKVKITPHGFTCTGHANAGPYGSDIVCAAVSSLVQATVLALHETCFARHTIETGYVGVDYKKTKYTADIIDFMMLPMRLGIAEIAKQYPEFVIIEE